MHENQVNEIGAGTNELDKIMENQMHENQVNEIGNCAAAAKPNKKKRFLLILSIAILLLICFFIFYGRSVSVCVEVSRGYSYSTNYYYRATLSEQKNWEYRLYEKNQLIASKKSSADKVVFYDIKVKKGTVLRAEMVPLSDNGLILEKEITLNKEIWDQKIKKTKSDPGMGNSPARQNDDKIVLHIVCQ